MGLGLRSLTGEDNVARKEIMKLMSNLPKLPMSLITMRINPLMDILLEDTETVSNDRKRLSGAESPEGPPYKEGTAVFALQMQQSLLEERRGHPTLNAG